MSLLMSKQKTPMATGKCCLKLQCVFNKTGVAHLYSHPRSLALSPHGSRSPLGAADDLCRAGWISGAAARSGELLGWASQRAAGGSRRGRGAAQLPGISRHSSAGENEQFDFRPRSVIIIRLPSHTQLKKQPLSSCNDPLPAYNVS